MSRLHVFAFAIALTAWTIALLSPVPHQSAQEVLGGDWQVFLFGKGLHIGVYAALTVLGGTAVRFGRRWGWVLPGLLLHGSLIEVIQPHVGRTGSVRDVGLDAIGIGLGGLVVLAWRSLRRPEGPTSPG